MATLRERLFFRAAGAGFLHGALLYGSGVSLLHVFHNRIPSAGEALLLLFHSAWIYGLWSALAFLVVVALARGLRRLAARRSGAAGGRRRPPVPRELFSAAFVFTFAFWFLQLNYGLTYDQVPFGELEGAAGMVLYLAARGVAIAAAAAAASWVLARGLRWAGESRRGRWAAGGLFLAVALVHAAAGGAYGMAAADAPPRAVPTGVRAAAPEGAPTGLKVVLLGVDGADWQVIRPLLAGGQLPNLRRLVEGGSHGPLATLKHTNSPVIWASIYTGKRPAEHGILDFYTIRLPGMERGVFPVHRTFFKEIAGGLEVLGLAERRTVDRSWVPVPLIWEILAAAGRSVGVVDGYYFSYPAPEPAGDYSFFLSYGVDGFYRYWDARGRPPAAVPEARRYAVPVELLEEVGPELSGYEFDWQSSVLLTLLARRPQPRFINFYTHQPDVVQHWYWKYYEPRYFLAVDRRGLAEHASEIPDFYRRLDAFLGELLGRLEEDTVLILASDHGHSPTLFHKVSTQHRHGPPGVLILYGGPVRRGHELRGAHVFDLFPTVLHLLGLPVPQDAAGRPLAEALAPDFRRRHPVATIPSYDPLLAPLVPPEGAPDRQRHRQELEKLRALGYIQ